MCNPVRIEGVKEYTMALETEQYYSLYQQNPPSIITHFQVRLINIFHFIQGISFVGELILKLSHIHQNRLN